MPIFDASSPAPRLFWEFYDRWVSPAVVQTLEEDLHRGMLVRVRPGGRVLDVGSGGGQHTVRAAQDRPDLQVEGVDNAPAMVKRAQALVRKAGVGARVRIQEGDALALPFGDAEFDAVWCAGPLKQVTDKARVLRECYRVLRPGGELLAMEVDRGCTYEDVVTFSNRTPLPAPLRAGLKAYFLTYVASQSIDLDEARALWSQFAWAESDGPRRIPGSPALVMVGRKPG